MVKTAGGCLAVGRINVVVKECKEVPIPRPLIFYRNQPVEAIGLCPGGTLLLGVKDAGDWLYQWQLDGQNIAGATNPDYRANRSGTYTVIRNAALVVPGTCSKPTKSDQLIVSPGSPPLAMIKAVSRILCTGSTQKLSTDEVDSYRYEWRQDGRVLTETLPESTRVTPVRKEP